MKKEMTYEKAYSELENIVSEIENEETPLDVLSEKIKRALELINFCRTKLRSVDDIVNSTLSDSEN